MSNGKLYSLSSPQQKNPIRENGNEKNPLSESARQLNVSYKSDEQLNKETVKRIANYGGVVSATLRTFVSALCEFYNSRQIHSALQYRTPDEVYFGTCNRQTIV